MKTQFPRIRKAAAILSCLLILPVLGGCAHDQTTGKLVVDQAKLQEVKQVTKEVAQGVLQSAKWAAPVASMVIAGYGDEDAQDAMAMASKSLNTLTTLLDKSSTQDQLNATFAALQVAWGGIDSAYKNDPDAAAKMAAIQTATEAASKLVLGGEQAAVPTTPGQ